MRIKFIQTCDAERYARMLDVSSASVRAYCDTHGCEYESFRGVKIGASPRHATYNRIPLLNEELDRGFDGWLCFLDADAFIVDFRFDLRAYLAQFSDRAFVLRASRPGEDMAWRVNAGVLLVNTRHPLAVKALRAWRFWLRLAVAAGQLAAPPRFAWVDDQNLLQFHLLLHPATRRAIHYETPRLLNGADASFIPHYLLSDVPDFDMRVAMIAARIDRAFAEAGVDPSPRRGLVGKA